MPWTPDAVERWLVIAYAADTRSPGIAGALSWPALYVLDLGEQVAVHTSAWARAGGHSISELLRERPRLGSRATFERRRAAGLAAIAAGLNRDEKRT